MSKVGDTQTFNAKFWSSVKCMVPTASLTSNSRTFHEKIFQIQGPKTTLLKTLCPFTDVK